VCALDRLSYATCVDARAGAKKRQRDQNLHVAAECVREVADEADERVVADPSRQRRPDAEAIVRDPRRRLSYSQHERRSDSRAAHEPNRGVSDASARGSAAQRGLRGPVAARQWVTVAAVANPTAQILAV
jgi:hypothetical protein